MRRIFRILKWMGLGLCSLVFLATVVLWVRSIGHREVWRYRPEPPDPDGTYQMHDARGWGYWWYIQFSHGRLWFEAKNWRTVYEWDWEKQHEREAENYGPFEFGSSKREFFGGVAEHRRVFRKIGYWYSWGGWASYREFGLTFPLWMPAVLFGAWPAIFTARRVVRWRRKKRRLAAGLCMSCGYDLRATPERCPECGTVMKKADAQAPA